MKQELVSSTYYCYHYSFKPRLYEYKITEEEIKITKKKKQTIYLKKKTWLNILKYNYVLLLKQYGILLFSRHALSI